MTHYFERREVNSNPKIFTLYLPRSAQYSERNSSEPDRLIIDAPCTYEHIFESYGTEKGPKGDRIAVARVNGTCREKLLLRDLHLPPKLTPSLKGDRRNIL